MIRRLLGGTSRFRANVKKIAVANLAGQVLGVASLPVLSRLFSPEDFGVLTAYSVVQGIGLSIASGRLDWIIPNVSTERKAHRLLAVGFVFVVCTTLVAAAAVAVAGPSLLPRFGDAATIEVLWILPLGFAAGGTNLLLQSCSVFQGDLTDVSRARVFQAVSTLVASLVAGWVAPTSFGLVAAYVLGLVTAALTMAYQHRQDPVLWRSARGSSVRRTLVNYSRHISANVALGLINNLTTASIMILVIFWYTSEVVGWYGLVFRVAAAPIGLVTQALVKSFWTDAAALAKTDPRALRQFYIGTVARLAVLGVIVIIVALFAPLYVPPIFGREEWTGAGALLAAASPYLFALVVFSPTTHLVVYMKGHWQVVSDLLTVTVASAAFSLSAASGGPAWTSILCASLALLVGYTGRFGLHLYANSQLIRRSGGEQDAESPAPEGKWGE